MKPKKKTELTTTLALFTIQYVSIVGVILWIFLPKITKLEKRVEDLERTEPRVWVDQEKMKPYIHSNNGDFYLGDNKK